MLFPGYAPIYTPVGLNPPVGWVAPVAPVGWAGYGPGWGHGWGHGHGWGRGWGRGDDWGRGWGHRGRW